jgi:hypothetical protein
MFEREGGGDEGGQKWSACVRLGPHIFKKIKNLVLPMRVMEMRQGEQDGWDGMGRMGAAGDGNAECGISKQKSSGNPGNGVGSHLLGLARIFGRGDLRRSNAPRSVTGCWLDRGLHMGKRSPHQSRAAGLIWTVWFGFRGEFFVLHGADCW